jgi:hypothetical protein
MLGSSRVVAQLAASQEGLSSVVVVMMMTMTMTMMMMTTTTTTTIILPF